jgi:hypothetical protein
MWWMKMSKMSRFEMPSPLKQGRLDRTPTEKRLDGDEHDELEALGDLYGYSEAQIRLAHDLLPGLKDRGYPAAYSLTIAHAWDGVRNSELKRSALTRINAMKGEKL